MKALIFGASGQDGHYLSQLCEQKGIESLKFSRNGPKIADISDYEKVQQIIKNTTPNYIFHLAANSTTRHDALFENHATISTGTLNLLEAAYKHSPNSKIFITGSGVQFFNDGKAISENHPFEASSPYAIARIQSVYAARYYRNLGLKTYVGYLFHHESPLRKPNHVSQKVAMAAKLIAQGSQEKLYIGDLSVQKEWTFAGDVAEAIITLIEQDNIFETVIGSGQTYSIQEWVEECFSKLGLNWQLFVETQPNFQVEYKRLVSNPALIQSLGWKPKTSLQKLANMMLE